jgi:hypothetical protein
LRKADRVCLILALSQFLVELHRKYVLAGIRDSLLNPILKVGAGTLELAATIRYDILTVA